MEKKDKEEKTRNGLPRTPRFRHAWFFNQNFEFTFLFDVMQFTRQKSKISKWFHILFQINLKKCLFSSFQTNSKTSKWFTFQIKNFKNEFLFSWKIKLQKYNSLKFMYLSILLNPKIRNQVKIKGFPEIKSK